MKGHPKALRPILIAKPGKDEGAKWNLLFPRGEWHGANLAPLGGSIVLDDAVFDSMIANWKASGSPGLPVTFHHVDAEFAPGVPPEEMKKAAGWVENLRKTDAGLEGLVAWTPNARARIEADEYRYFSPEWTNKGTDRRTGNEIGWWLYGVALLNDPFFNEMPRVAANDKQSTHTNPTTGAEPKERSMNEQMKKRLCAALGLPETTPDEEVLAKCEAKCKAADDAAKLTAANAEKVTAMQASHSALTAKVEALEKTNAALAEAQFTADVTTLCDHLIKAGQIIPAHREKVVAFAKKAGIAEAREVYGSLPKSGAGAAAAGEIGTTGKQEETGDVKILAAEYETEMDKALASGEDVAAVSRRLRKDPKFRPYLVASQKSLTTPTEKEN